MDFILKRQKNFLLNELPIRFCMPASFDIGIYSKSGKNFTFPGSIIHQSSCTQLVPSGKNPVSVHESRVKVDWLRQREAFPRTGEAVSAPRISVVENRNL
jgi:hypothetical protein